MSLDEKQKFTTVICVTSLYTCVETDQQMHLSCVLLYLQDGSYMFRQDSAILREWLGSFWVTSSVW
jgi:hypothetical protein